MNKVIPNIAPSTGNPYVIPKESTGNISSETASEKSEASISLKTKRFESDVSEKENQIKRDCLANISGKLPVQFKTSVNVGFSKMPKQIYRKAIQRGFTFNIMLVGVTGLGKSTFLNTLFMTDIYNDEHPGPSTRYHKENSATSSVTSQTFHIIEADVHLRLTVTDAPGYGEALDNSACWRLLVEEINRRNAAFMEAESKVERKTVGGGGSGRLGVMPEDLIHACFYFLSPTGHGVRQMDLEAMRALHDKVSLRLFLRLYYSFHKEAVI
ncbi:unnamed protein product [Hymenolepis diminuta]|uniref:Septin-type G domain-containing protein n=1 Tax=Hymenolepis diminuta TaxID=6216 RepID=A0A0R3SH11_HYMDI|nr:unnamed protein product [Hymenolepis diminuta]